VLTRHPGEVFWRTGRPALEVATSERPGDADADADAIARGRREPGADRNPTPGGAHDPADVARDARQ
jgi:hypothetical protein